MLVTEPYTRQVIIWPQTGRHILAQHDDDTIVVYQAYRPSIGHYAAEHGRFGGGFSFERMSWIKPNFLWMMYRSGWGAKKGQEVTLAIRLRRRFFDSILAQAVPSSWDHNPYPTHEEWSQAVGQSEVRLQWDPDHQPSGARTERRAIQLGLRGSVLRAYATDEVVELLDLSAFVSEQHENLNVKGIAGLQTPRERVYVPSDPAVAVRLGLCPEKE